MAFDLDEEELEATRKLHKCDKSIKGTDLIIKGIDDTDWFINRQDSIEWKEKTKENV